MKRTFEGYPSGFVNLFIVPLGFAEDELLGAYNRQVERVLNGLRARNAIFNRTALEDDDLGPDVINPVVIYPIDRVFGSGIPEISPVMYTNRGFTFSLIPSRGISLEAVKHTYALYTSPKNEKWDIITYNGEMKITEFLKKVGH